MKQRTLLIIAVSLVAVGLSGVAVTLALDTIGSIAAPSLGVRGRAGAVEAMFIERMVPHHQDAIDMAELAESKAEHPEIRELAADIRRNQSAENEQMREWYRDWFGAEVPEVSDRGMMGPMMRGGSDLDRLRSAEDFDREFIEQMVPHHQMGIMMARMAGRSAEREELRELADSIIETQSQEIEDMERWYREWYGDQ